MAYAIFFQPAARRELNALERSAQRRVVAAIERLADNPRPAGCSKLSGFRDVWRIRIGDFRVLYRVQDKQLIIEIIRIGNRRDVYRGF
jgi:mRNA interferase RelE/StbE